MISRPEHLAYRTLSGREIIIPSNARTLGGVETPPFGFMRTFGRVEDGRGGTANGAPFPIPAHRTGRADFPHPALRQVSSPDSRTGTQMHATHLQHAQRSEDHLVRQDAHTPRGHVMPLSQKVTNALGNVVIDRPIRQQPGSVAEVARPAAQNAVQPVSHLRPRALIAGYQDVVHLLPQPRHTLLRRAGSQVPVTILPVVLRPERVPQKVKTLLASFLERGLRLVQG